MEKLNTYLNLLNIAITLCQWLGVKPIDLWNNILFWRGFALVSFLIIVFWSLGYTIVKK